MGKRSLKFTSRSKTNVAAFKKHLKAKQTKIRTQEYLTFKKSRIITSSHVCASIS